MSATQAIAGELAKGCSSARARDVTGIGQIVERFLWSRFHYWSIPMIAALSFACAFMKAICRRMAWYWTTRR